MIISTECPRCNGTGFVGHDDLSPDDYTVACPRCLGTGVVDYDPEDEVEEWMR